jgi:peroxiredoxin
MSQGAETTTEPQSSPAPTQPMQHGHRPASSERIPASLVPETGWHFLHVFYRVDRAALAGLDEATKAEGRRQILEAVDRGKAGAPEQIHVFAVPGHKADFGVMMAGTDLRAIHGIQMAIQGSALGPALVPTYSFYSITEISE